MKVKSIKSGNESSFRRYRRLCYGSAPIYTVLWSEFVTFMLTGLPGAAGILLRSKLYRGLFGSAGKGILIGRNTMFRHFNKLRLGSNVIIDDNAVLDAKGDTNHGIKIGNDVFIGRNTIIYCKNGDIILHDGVNISSNCIVFSSNHLEIGAGTMIGAYSYLLSGGEYDYENDTPFCMQSGMETRGPLTIGEDCWLGARVTVLDAASIGNRCVIGAGAVVTRRIPDQTLAAGVPARKLKTI